MPFSDQEYQNLLHESTTLAAEVSALIADDMQPPDITIPPLPYSGNPIININGSAWYAEQIFDPQVMVDPSDATKLIMFATGMAAPAASNNLTIGKFTSTVSGYTSWSEVGQVLLPTAATWDSTFVRVGSCFYSGGTFYLFYTGSNGNNASVGLATSTDGTTFTKSGSNPILTPTGNGRNDGDHVSEPAVYFDGTTWTMIYGYRNGGTILPGYRYATASSPSGTWTKGGAGDILTGPFYCEFHQIIKIGATFYLIYESGDTTHAFQIYAASASAVTGPFTGSVWLAPSGVVSAWDRYHVATPNIVQVGGNWQLFYSAAGNHDQPYTTNTWPLGVALAPYTPGQGWLKI